MYYHVLIETNEKVGKSKDANKSYYELDKTNLLEIEEDIVIPYLKKEGFQFDGYFLKHSEIARLVVKQSEKTTKECSKYENDNMPQNVIMYVSPSDTVHYDSYMKDITKQVFSEAKRKMDAKKIVINNTTIADTNIVSKGKKIEKSKVFIVHGHDETAELDLARFIEKMGFEAITLHEQVSSGKTIIEKIEEFSNVDFGIVLYTPCDLGAKKGEEQNLRARARQNVVFEHGYLIAKLGRKNVCALVKGNVETPNDISGVVYVPMDDHKAWKIAIAKELRNSGYSVDMNLII